MKPIILSIGKIKIYTASLFLSLAFLSSIFVIWKEGRKKGFEEEKVLDLVIISILSGIVFGRLGFVLLNRDLFSNLGQIILFWQVSGISFWLATLSGFGAAFLIIRRNHWPIDLMLDLLMLGFNLGLAIYKLGLFISGAGFGSQTNSFLGIHFLGLPEKRFPISLFESLIFIIGFAVFFRLWNKEKLKKGHLFSIGLILIGACESLMFFISEKALLSNAALTLVTRLSIMMLGFFAFHLFSGRQIKKDFSSIFNRVKMRKIKNQGEDNAQDESYSN